MGWRVKDLSDSKHTLKVNAWNWRPTLVILNTFEILDAHRLEMMNYNGSVEVTVDEAREIGHKLHNYLQENMDIGNSLNLDLTINDYSSDSQFHKDVLQKNYSATFVWLQSFMDFCRTCGGFEVT